MKLTNLIVSCVALSAVLLAAPAEAKDKHKKHKKHKHHHDNSCYDDRRGDHSYYGRSYYPGGSYYAPGTEPPGWYDRSRYYPYRYSNRYW